MHDSGTEKMCNLWFFSAQNQKKKLSKIEIVTDQTDERKLYSKAYMLEIELKHIFDIHTVICILIRPNTIITVKQYFRLFWLVEKTL